MKAVGDMRLSSRIAFDTAVLFALVAFVLAVAIRNLGPTQIPAALATALTIALLDLFPISLGLAGELRLTLVIFIPMLVLFGWPAAILGVGIGTMARFLHQPPREAFARSVDRLASLVVGASLAAIFLVSNPQREIGAAFLAGVGYAIARTLIVAARMNAEKSISWEATVRFLASATFPHLGVFTAIAAVTVWLLRSGSSPINLLLVPMVASAVALLLYLPRILRGREQRKELAAGSAPTAPADPTAPDAAVPDAAVLTVGERPMKLGTIFVIGILVAIGTAVFAANHANAPRPDPALRTAVVTRGAVSTAVSATGPITAASQVDVRSRATGTVTQIHVQEGAQVVQGELLATIDDPDARAALREAQAQVVEARANVTDARVKLAQARQNVPLAADQSAASIAQAQAAVASAKARLETLRTGFRPEQIAQARQAVRQAQANLDLAKANLDRDRRLHAEGAIALASLEQSRAQYEVAVSQLQSAKQQLQLEEAGPLPSDMAAAEAEVRRAEAQLADAKASSQTVEVRRGDVGLAEAALERAQAQLAKAEARLRNAQERYDEGTVRAPIAGVVAKRLIQVGQTVIGGTATSGTLVFTLADTTPLLAAVNVDETDIAKLKVGMPVQLTVDALPNAIFEGVVERIAPASVVAQNVNQYTVTVEIKNPSPALRLGMTVDAEFIAGQARNVLVVPTEAVRGEAPTKYILVVDGRNQLSTRPVTTGLSDDRNTEVISGLQEGERVYLGAVPSAAPSPPRPRNPFMPNFQRRPSGGTGTSGGGR